MNPLRHLQNPLNSSQYILACSNDMYLTVDDVYSNLRLSDTLLMVLFSLKTTTSAGANDDSELQRTEVAEVLSAKARRPPEIWTLDSLDEGIVYNWFFDNSKSAFAPVAFSSFQDGIGIATLTWSYPATQQAITGSSTSLSGNKLVFGHWHHKIPKDIRREASFIFHEVVTVGFGVNREKYYEKVHINLQAGNTLSQAAAAKPYVPLAEGDPDDVLVPQSGACAGQLLEFTANADWYSGVAYGIVFPMVSMHDMHDI